jgi:hypothetical protein
MQTHSAYSHANKLEDLVLSFYSPSFEKITVLHYNCERLS